MSKRTIICKMAPTQAMTQALAATCQAFAAACNAALEFNVSNKYRLHHLAYRIIRERYGLTANLAVRAVARVAAALLAAKKRGRKPSLFRPTSIDYDAKVFDYREREETVSLSTVGGRVHVPLVLGEYQRGALAGKKPTAATVVHKDKRWFIHIVVEDADEAPRTGPALGIDLGIRNTAATSLGTLHSGKERQQFKEKRMRVRASLQSKGTAGAKRVLRCLSGHEQRRIRHENHVLSKRIVDEALNAHCGSIRMEKLVGIRQRTKIWNPHFNRMVAGWSFGQLQDFLSYKAKRRGLAVEYVNPAYTSQTCSRCGERGVRKVDVFTCTTCGETAHADLNAARNIAGGAARKPARIEALLCVATHGVDLESRLL